MKVVFETRQDGFRCLGPVKDCQLVWHRLEEYQSRLW
jgi:hypothetical protein